MSIDGTITTGNMRVVNEEYDRVLDNPDHVIMSEELKEIMGLEFNEEHQEPTAEEHKLSIIADPLECATTTGHLHTLQFTNQMNIGLEVSKCSPEMLQALHAVTSKRQPITIALTGDNGFEAEESIVSSFGLVKMAPHSFLLTLTFGSENVIF